MAAIIADKFGRKKTFIPLTFLMGISGLGCSVIETYEGFLAFRFLNAFSKQGKMIIVAN